MPGTTLDGIPESLVPGLTVLVAICGAIALLFASQMLPSNAQKPEVTAGSKSPGSS